MTNPYAPPKSALVEPTSMGARLLDALVIGLPVSLCALHALAILGVLSYVGVDIATGRDTSLREVLQRPLVIVQPLCTLATALFLLLRRRVALVGACALPCVILIHATYYDTQLSWVYFGCASLLALHVGGLAVLRKLG